MTICGDNAVHHPPASLLEFYTIRQNNHCYLSSWGAPFHDEPTPNCGISRSTLSGSELARPVSTAIASGEKGRTVIRLRTGVDEADHNTQELSIRAVASGQEFCWLCGFTLHARRYLPYVATVCQIQALQHLIDWQSCRDSSIEKCVTSIHCRSMM